AAIIPGEGIESNRKMISVSDFEFLAESGFIQTRVAGCSRPRDCIFKLDAARRRRWGFIQKCKMPSSAKTDQWPRRQHKNAELTKLFHHGARSRRDYRRETAGTISSRSSMAALASTRASCT